MRVVLQRVRTASVTIDGKLFSSIGFGLLIFLGIEVSDNREDVEKLVSKICKLRIFNDAEGIMNLSNEEVGGQYLVISQFTLHAETRKGNRPSYIKSARPEQAIPLYEMFIQKLEECAPGKVGTGEFGADMKVELLNDGPVTILIDSKSWN